MNTVRNPRFALVAVLIAIGFLAACGDQVQKAKPPEKPAATTGMPPGHPPLPSDHPTIGHGAASRAHGGDPFAEGHGTTPAMGEAPAGDPERVIVSGEIALDPAVKVGEQYVVYVATVFSPQERAPVYTKKYDSPKFPFRFEIKEKDKGAAAGTVSDRPLYVRAMISDTGDVMKSRNRTLSDLAYPRGATDAKVTIKP
jgi:hypothetical protein